MCCGEHIIDIFRDLLNKLVHSEVKFTILQNKLLIYFFLSIFNNYK